MRKGDGQLLQDLPRFLRGLHLNEHAELVMTSFYYEPPSVHQDKGFKGDVSAAYAWAAQVVEVEVDTATGVVRLLGVDAAHDVGDAQHEPAADLARRHHARARLGSQHGLERDPPAGIRGFLDHRDSRLLPLRVTIHRVRRDHDGAVRRAGDLA